MPSAGSPPTAFGLGWVPLDLIDWADPDGVAADMADQQPERVRMLAGASVAADRDHDSSACADGSRRLAVLRLLDADRVLPWVPEPLEEGGCADWVSHPVP